jgi:hypothetical protein
LLPQSLVDIDGIMVKTKEGSTHRLTRELSSINPEENSRREAITAFLPSCKHHNLASRLNEETTTTTIKVVQAPRGQIQNFISIDVTKL